MVKGITSQGCTPHWVSAIEPTIAERPAAAPTERSMPPMSSTRVCPSATSPTNAAWRTTTCHVVG